MQMDRAVIAFGPRARKQSNCRQDVRTVFETVCWSPKTPMHAGDGGRRGLPGLYAGVAAGTRPQLVGEKRGCSSAR